MTSFVFKKKRRRTNSFGVEFVQTIDVAVFKRVNFGAQRRITLGVNVVDDVARHAGAHYFKLAN